MAETENRGLAPIQANGRGLVLSNLEDMWRFAQKVIESGIAPATLNTPAKIFVVLQSGAELGMGPMRSLNSFYVVNGQARLFGDTPLALVRQSALLEYIKEHIDGEGDGRVAVCETKRKGDPEPKITEFSVEDAQLAGLWGKAGPWKQYPKRMLTYRARAFNLRDNFPDCFGGATIAEEYEGIDPPEPSHEPTMPRRKEVEAKVVEAPEPEAPETAEEEAPAIDHSLLIKELIVGVYKIFREHNRNGNQDDFAALAATTCGGVPDDYVCFDGEMNHKLDPDAFTAEMLSSIKAAIEDGALEEATHAN